ncbi:MAG: hypothetical protein WC100_04435 [Sterolibacterium sp.]
MEMQEAYQKKMSAQLKEWNAQIALLDAKLENMSADLRVERTKHLHALRARQSAVAEKMLELGKASGEAWEQIKQTTDKVWDDLKKGLVEAQSKFK